MSGRPKLVGLVVASVGDDLSRCLGSLEPCCDAVIAIDRAGTDEVLTVLKKHPLVETVLPPPGPPGADSDEASDRRALLEEAARLDPQWVVSVDGEEALDREDALALRGFLESEALPGFAFGLRRYRMWQDDLYDPDIVFRYRETFRLYAFRAGQRLPERHLYFNPVPTEIPPNAYVMTTVRVKDFGANTVEATRARAGREPSEQFRRYHTSEWPVPKFLLPWQRRPEGLPALGRLSPAMANFLGGV